MSHATESGWVTRFVSRGAARADVVDDRRLTGYPIVFNTWSQDLGGFRERIAPSAVERTLRNGDNVDALIDHRRETTSILGSTDSGLLRLKKDRHGLHMMVEPPDTTTARDVLTNVRAGLIKGMSFSFMVMPGGQEWDEGADGVLERTVNDMLFSEVSIVINPAYLQTEVSARNLAIDQRALDDYVASLQHRPSRAMRELELRARGL
jgi:HK97 family phage prohead protease